MRPLSIFSSHLRKVVVQRLSNKMLVLSWVKDPMASLVAQRLKRLPAVRETWVRSLVQEDPLEKEIATHSNNLAWRIPWMEEPGGLQSMGSKRVRHNRATSLHSPLRPWSREMWFWVWESQLLARLIRSPRTPRKRKGSGALKKEKGVQGSQGGEKDKHFFFYIALF